MTRENPHFPRASGVLLHPTCLPGRLGIGNLGAGARRFVDWLAGHGQSVWQLLPLGPTTYGDSPYQTLSAFAGNPLLIDPDDLVAAGWLAAADVETAVHAGGWAPRADRVEFGRVLGLVPPLLDRAWDGFQRAAAPARRAAFAAWCAAHAAWLDDWALFIALKERQGGRPWPEWPAPLRDREPAALAGARAELAGALERHRFRQWIFHEQWAALRAHANGAGVRLIGDVPIFVAHDSSDVWAHRDLFHLDAAGQPTVVAGVPPDYFSKTGQRWGNPLYRWDALRAEGFGWWIDRFRQALTLVDAVRVDHFRGFAAYWEIPAGEPTAVKGRWVRAEGAALFAALRDALRQAPGPPPGHAGDEAAPPLPIIAEDLGVITPDVEALRDAYELPGMKVLQFAWSDPRNPFLPHAHRENCVVYSGTHDNNTTVGWWREEAGPQARAFLAAYLDRDAGAPGWEPHWALIRLGMMSPAHTFVAPMQDVLGLGPEARLNTPGRADGNWDWRLPAGALDGPEGTRLAELTWLYRRRPDQQLPEPGAGNGYGANGDGDGRAADPARR